MDAVTLGNFYTAFNAQVDEEGDKTIESKMTEHLRMGYNGDPTSLEGLAEFAETILRSIQKVTS